jgi:hypothetical protein
MSIEGAWKTRHYFYKVFAFQLALVEANAFHIAKTFYKTEMDKIGADRVKAEYGDDVIAYVTTSKPKFKWVIKNEREFVKWVKSNISSEIVETVRESSIDAILDKFHYINGDDVIDPNGERVEWLEGTIAEPYLVTKFHSDGRERLKDAFQSGQLEFKKIWELE